MDEQLRIAIEELTEAINTMNGNLGRGIGRNAAGKTGGVNRGGPEKAAADQIDKMAQGMSKINRLEMMRVQAIAEQIKEGKKLADADRRYLDANKKARDEVERLTKATGNATTAEKDREKATRTVARSLGDFGKNVVFGSGNLSNAFDSLSSKLDGAAWSAKASGSKFTGLLEGLSKFSGALAFSISSMYRFADNAREMSGIIDLSRVSVGLLTEARLFSALDKGFTKVINESAGSFRVFGKNTEEAVKNLSDLSRGLRLGSSFVRGSLGKEFAKDFDEASKATAQLGLTQEEQGALQASIMQQVRMRARSEKEAQQMLVRQYRDTAVSARDLSNQFGVSAKEILKSMEDFKKSTAGRLAGRLGVTGAEEIKTTLQQLMPTLSEDQVNRMALDMARGQFGAAMAAAPAEYQESGRALVQAIQQAQSMEGGVAKNLGKTTRDMADVFEGIGRSRQEMSSTLLGEMSDAGLYASEFATRLRESDKTRAEQEKKTGRTEADNVKATTNLSGSMDMLRGAVNALTASILGLGAILGPLALTMGGFTLQGGLKGLFSGLTSIFKTGLGKIATGIGSLFGKGALAASAAPAAAGIAATGAGAAGAAGTAAAGGGILAGLAKYGAKLPGGSIGKAALTGAKGFGLGAVGGLVGDLAADALGRDTRAGAAADVAGTAASYAGTGAMIGSFIPGLGTAIGAAVGGALGLGKGLYTNASTLFKPSETAAPLEPSSQVPTERTSKDMQQTDMGKDRPDMQQIMSYLSQITNDISAIRSNTRGDNATTPVRLG